MKTLLLFFASTLLNVSVYSQKWSLDKSHAKLGFTVSHLVISEVDGSFKNFDAQISTKSNNDFADAVFTLTAQTNSIDTENEKRDKHLKQNDFFDVDKYPTLSFTSTQTKKIKNNQYKIKGNLTMHGVTLPIEINATITIGKNPYTKSDFAVINATGNFNRLDFGIGTDTPKAMVGDEITLKAKGEFILD
jgi:polyisoprenoid-binding protein YceI